MKLSNFLLLKKSPQNIKIWAFFDKVLCQYPIWRQILWNRIMPIKRMDSCANICSHLIKAIYSGGKNWTISDQLLRMFYNYSYTNIMLVLNTWYMIWPYECQKQVRVHYKNCMNWSWMVIFFGYHIQCWCHVMVINKDESFAH